MDWFAVSTSILRDPRTWAFADALGLNPAHAAGHLLGIYGLLATSGDASGRVASLSNHLLEDAALWRGKKGRFADAFRAHYQDEDGNLRNWKSWNGADIARVKSERIRKREARRLAKASAGPSAPRPADRPRTPDGRGDGAALAPDLTRPDRTELPLPTTRESPRGDRGGWVAQAVAAWAEHIGVVPHGRMGQALEQAVQTYGAPAVLAAIREFGKWRARSLHEFADKPPGLPHFVANLRLHIPHNLLPPEAA